MTTIFEAACEIEPDDDSIKVERLHGRLMFVGDDHEGDMQTSAVLGPDAVEKLRDALTKWLEAINE